ncbi:MAG: helix-turn-helix transcriptional regulator [Clostridia bacterium]|nr:helix-turn-helix transcriptional regulator [Clostridia bacterium]
MSKISYIKTKNFHVEKCQLKKPQANMHYHHAYELYYILDGEREYFIDDTFFKVSKGDLVWVPANMLHRTDGKGATRFLLYFKPEFIEKYVHKPMLEKLFPAEPFVFHADATNDKQINTLLNRLLNEYAQQDKADEMLFIGYLLQLLFLIYTVENNYVSEIPQDNHASQIIKYINENYANILGMEEVANKFFISKYYLCRIFKRSIGVSFVSYLNTIRIKAACELLKTESLYLSEIAIRCGFNSTPYFCKVFKDEKGVSPSEYRNKFKN